MTRSIAIFLLVVFALSLQGCSKESVDEYTEKYIEYRTISATEDWLLSVCEPDNWCEPYSEAAAIKCLDEYLDFGSLLELSRNEIYKAIDDVFFDVQACALGEVTALYTQQQRKKT